MNIERLTKLAELLDKVALERRPFNLSVWVHKTQDLCFMDVKDTAVASGLSEDEVEHHECGTVACAVGYACLDPWFNEQGLRAYEDLPSYRYSSGWDAVEDFFGIYYEEARHLFSPDSYTGEEETRAEEVAARIREFIASETQS